MVYHDTHASFANDMFYRALAGTKSLFSAIGHSMIAVSSANHRMKLVEKLQAKSDQELAALGIRREDIVRHVFIDMLDA